MLTFWGEKRAFLFYYQVDYEKGSLVQEVGEELPFQKM